MVDFRFKICEKVFAVHAIHENILPSYHDYLTDEAPDFDITTTQEQIEYEKKKCLANNSGAHFSDSYYERLAIYRQIANIMPEYDTFLFHASALAVDGQAYLFTAKSGTGKSTHARLWREMLGDRVVMVNDDKPMIQITDAGPLVWGTPYNGKHGLSTNIAVPIRAVCIISQAKENRIRKINREDACFMMIQQAHRPHDSAMLDKTLTLIGKLLDSVEFYRLECNMEQEAAQLSYQTMRGMLE